MNSNDDQNSEDEGYDSEDDSLSEDDESVSSVDYWSDDFEDGYKSTEKLNEETHDKIKLNDPSITSLEVELTGEYVQSVNWNLASESMGSNTQLRKIEITSQDVSDNHNWRNIMGSTQLFCHGLAKNHFIEAFCIFESDLSCNNIFSTLRPFFIHTNLVRIDFYESDIGKQNTFLLASALQKRWNKRSLEVLAIYNCDMGGEDAVGELMSALEGYEHLLKLSLSDCELGGRQCFVSLANILLEPDCRLDRLELGYNNVGTPQNSLALANALSKNTSLKSLDFSGTRVDEEEAIELCNALVKNNTLKYLKLANTLMGSVGLRSLSNRYQYLISSLTFLELGCYNPRINDQEVSVLGAAINNATLKGLELDGIGNSITSTGWQAFSVCLQSPNSTLTRLSIESCNLDDEKLTVIANALVNNSMLNTLLLGSNSSISAHGWQSLSTCLRSPNSALQEIGMHSCNLTDEIMIGFAEALASNTCLRVLATYLNDNITERSWISLHRIVCNSSSIEATLESNHTLQSVEVSTTTVLDSALQLNWNFDKKQVARQKIIQHHFLKDDEVDVTKFVNMDMNVLPRAMAWIGREDDGGHSLMFSLLQSMPCLFDTDSMKALQNSGKASSSQVKKRRVF